MKKNNKGFTLVELLAAIVILGILIVFAAPRIMELLGTSRDKMYVNDAKKLISQAEYKIRAASSTINKPAEGECIAISLVFLDDSDFDNPPNNGKYLKEASFVIVYNRDGHLEYSATIVENMKKGGYKGVELTSEGNLEKNNATKYVRVFSESELVYIEGGKTGKKLDNEYINSKLGYNVASDGITDIYNYPDLEDSTSKAGDEPPEIGVAQLRPLYSTDYNSLDALLYVTVKDPDTPRSKLKVYLSFKSFNDAVGYGQVGADGDNLFESAAFTKIYHFGEEPYNYTYNGQKITLYVVVRDPQGNQDEKYIDYVLHLNEPPIINDKSNVSKRPLDHQAGPIAQLALYASDDITKTKDLLVCFNDAQIEGDYNGSGLNVSYEYLPADKKAEVDAKAKTLANSESMADCRYSEYKKYGDIFNKEGFYDYQFHCPGSPGNICKYKDGSIHVLKVFVKDEADSNNPTTKYFIYKFHNNVGPKLDSSVQIDSFDEDFITDPSTGGSINAYITFSASDIDATDQLFDIDIYEVDKNNHEISGHEHMRSTNDPDHGNKIQYRFSGNYSSADSNRYLMIRLTDADGGTTLYGPYIYKVYKNKPPEISNIKIKGTERPCLNSDSFCSEEMDETKGGSHETLVSFTLNDDMDKNILDDMKICVTESSTGCNNKSDYDTAYSVYKNDSGEYTFTTKGTKNYDDTDGGNRNLYVRAIDSEDLMSTINSNSTGVYKVYTNQPPSLVGTPIVTSSSKYYDTPNDGENGSSSRDYSLYDLSTAVAEFSAIDDFDETSSMKVKLCYKKGSGAQVCSPTDNGYINYKNTIDIDFNTDNYQGQTYDVNIYVKDSYGKASNASSTTYTLYNDVAPSIKLEDASLDESGGAFNVNGKVSFTFLVDDPLDKFKVCAATSTSGCTKDSDFVGRTETECTYESVYMHVYDNKPADELSCDLLTLTYAKNKMCTNGVYLDDMGYEHPCTAEKKATMCENYTIPGEDGEEDETIEILKGTSDNPISCAMLDLDVAQANLCYNKVSNCGEVEKGDYTGDEPLTFKTYNYDLPKNFSGNKLYLFVKDSYGKKVSGKYPYITYDNIVKYNECDEVSFDEEFHEYSLATIDDDGHAITGNSAITTNRCGGNCYVNNKTGVNTTITSKYYDQLKYRDKYIKTKYCDKTKTLIDVDCSFMECFRNPNTNKFDDYVVIGTYNNRTEHNSANVGATFTTTVGGQTYTCGGTTGKKYFFVYNASYGSGDTGVTLIDSNERICEEAISHFSYNSHGNPIYIRVDDEHGTTG